MKIGIITVRDRTYHPNRRLGEAAKRRGHHAFLIHPYRVWPALGSRGAGLTRHPERRNPDVVLPRQGATIGDGCLPLIRQFSLMGIPVVNTLEAVLRAKHQFLTLQALKAVAELPGVLELQQGRKEVRVSRPVHEYIAEIIEQTRTHPGLRYGASPRGSLGLMRAGQALAVLRGRNYVLPDDIKYLVLPVLGHRIILKEEELLRGEKAETILTQIAQQVSVPAS